jgi:hypothetical protein
MQVNDVIRVFVGASPSEVLPLKVLEFTIREHTDMPVQVSFMADLECPSPKDEANQPGTKFSFYRFMIPQLAGYAGKALYLDSDMMVFKDMRDLWQIPFDGAQVLTVLTPEGQPTKNHSVLLIDCSAVDWTISEIVSGLDDRRYDYDQLMRDLCIVPNHRMRASIPYVWNSLDRYEPGKTALLHFTALHSQPWTGTRHPLAKVWVAALIRAVDKGAVDRAMLREEVTRGNIRPSLVYQVEAGIADPAALSNDILARDRQFVPPYQKLAKNRFPQRVRRKLRQLTRQVWARGLGLTHRA